MKTRQKLKAPSEEQRTNLLKTYSACLNNANELLSDAELLLENSSYARSFALAFTALEEVSKSQLVADLFTSFIEFNEFRSNFWDHQKKVDRMAWAILDRYGNLTDAELERLRPRLEARSGALFVDISPDYLPRSPSDVITKDDAEHLISVVETALQQIWYVSEWMGERIGTKGFMK